MSDHDIPAGELARELSLARTADLQPYQLVGALYHELNVIDAVIAECGAGNVGRDRHRAALRFALDVMEREFSDDEIDAARVYAAQLTMRRRNRARNEANRRPDLGRQPAAR